ncbi:MAG: DNA polymerase III subunit delta [Legionella sp.]|nr:DNA polymerase III subunit delta [Legionella sp.]
MGMIKYPDAAFDAHLKNNSFASIYILTGQDSFLLNNAALAIKKAWRDTQNTDNTETEEKRMSLEHANDWHDLVQETQSLSLFYNQLIIDATWNKKTFDAKSKAVLKHYIQNPSTDTLCILRAPLITAKQYSDFNNNPSVILITIQSLNAGAQIHWIKQQLNKQQFTYTDDIPKHIQAYTQGNLHASNQVIERLALTHEPNTKLTLEAVQAQCVDERQYKLYEISGACLDGNPKKALDLTKRARLDHVEPILILWFIAQELRILEKLAAGLSYQALNIYSFRAQQYQRASKRLSRDKIYQLIQQSQVLDTQIKSSNAQQNWRLTEQLILDFSV